jgi:hypothetical protein
MQPLVEAEHASLFVCVRTCSNPAVKRSFADVTGHSLAKANSQPKVSKDHAAARPGAAAAKPGGSMLVPPQLRGR